MLDFFSLKIKVKASTIVETMVASIIIIVIFTIASITLNNIFKSNINNDTTAIKTRLTKLEYFYKNNKLPIPYDENYKGWSINIKESINYEIKSVKIEAIKDRKQFLKTVPYAGY